LRNYPSAFSLISISLSLEKAMIYLTQQGNADEQNLKIEIANVSDAS